MVPSGMVGVFAVVYVGQEEGDGGQDKGRDTARRVASYLSEGIERRVCFLRSARSLTSRWTSCEGKDASLRSTMHSLSHEDAVTTRSRAP